MAISHPSGSDWTMQQQWFSFPNQECVIMMTRQVVSRCPYVAQLLINPVGLSYRPSKVPRTTYMIK
jgi:hypothetical protein